MIFLVFPRFCNIVFMEFEYLQPFYMNVWVGKKMIWSGSVRNWVEREICGIWGGQE